MDPVIGLAQIPYPKILQSGDLLYTVRDVFEKAVAQGADIICFPETIIQVEDPRRCADYITEHISPMCKKYGIWAVFGAVTYAEGMRNSAVILNREGEIADIYHKQNLLGGEKDYGMTAGTSPVILDTDFGRIGILICFDIFSARVVAQYEDQGVQIILCPSNMVVPILEMRDRQREMVISIATAISTQLNCCFGIAMAYGKELISESKVVSPERTIAEIKDEMGLLTAKLSLDDLSILPVLKMTEREQAEWLLSKK